MLSTPFPVPTRRPRPVPAEARSLLKQRACSKAGKRVHVPAEARCLLKQRACSKAGGHDRARPVPPPPPTPWTGAGALKRLAAGALPRPQTRRRPPRSGRSSTPVLVTSLLVKLLPVKFLLVKLLLVKF